MSTADERVERGMRAMLALRADRLAAGERPIGWKLGFGAPAALERLGTTAPLVGFMTDRSLVEPGSTVSLAGWRAPVLEPELAVTVGDDLGIAEVGPAIELVDLDASVSEPEAILAGNIFHRAVVLGPGRIRSVEGLRVQVLRDGEEIAAAADVEALTGALATLLPLAADTLRAAGAELRPGDVVIAGSTVPGIAVAPGQSIEYALSPVGTIELAFAPA